jgi:hypothetical protein
VDEVIDDRLKAEGINHKRNGDEIYGDVVESHPDEINQLEAAAPGEILEQEIGWELKNQPCPNKPRQNR